MNGIQLALLANALVVLAADLLLLSCYGEEATISLVVYKFACRHPILPFACGVCVGHILWPHR